MSPSRFSNVPGGAVEGSASGACARGVGAYRAFDSRDRPRRRHVGQAVALCAVYAVKSTAAIQQCRLEHCRVRVATLPCALGVLLKAAAISSRRRRSLLQRTFRVGAVHLKPPKFYEKRSMSINSSLSLSNSESSKKPIMPSLISSNW